MRQKFDPYIAGIISGIILFVFFQIFRVCVFGG